MHSLLAYRIRPLPVSCGSIGFLLNAKRNRVFTVSVASGRCSSSPQSIKSASLFSRLSDFGSPETYSARKTIYQPFAEHLMASMPTGLTCTPVSSKTSYLTASAGSSHG